jgi:hypothetical protein
MTTTLANARAVAEKCAEIAASWSDPDHSLTYRGAREDAAAAIRAYAASLPADAPQPATQRSESVAHVLENGSVAWVEGRFPGDLPPNTTLYAAPLSESAASGTSDGNKGL